MAGFGQADALRELHEHESSIAPVRRKERRT
jgi:hypothetical protein